MLILTAVIAAVDDYQDLLRLSVASAGNDHRLGGNEAPPAIISMYLGDELTDILESIAASRPAKGRTAMRMNLGAGNVAGFMKDTADRNRTSPFAFTGNKFEFRMLGSTTNISCPNVMINTAVAETIDRFATALENSKNVEEDAKKLIRETYLAHRRIVFNGNGYSEEWTEEAKKRGLSNITDTPAALERYTDEKNVALLTKYGVYSAEEIAARKEILLDNYAKTISIEANTMLEMVRREVLSAAVNFSAKLSHVVKDKVACGVSANTETDLLRRVAALTDAIYAGTDKLEKAAAEAKKAVGTSALAAAYRNKVVPAMESLRASCDELETITPRELWKMPTYSDLLFSV